MSGDSAGATTNPDLVDPSTVTACFGDGTNAVVPSPKQAVAKQSEVGNVDFVRSNKEMYVYV